jgi:hypothetical protein
MPKELPPETAQRVLDYLLAVEESLHPSQSITIFRRITVADFEALHACKPDPVSATICVPGDLAAMMTGEGVYDRFERAGWVKRQPKPVVEPEEWGPWVKLAKVGERPDGVEFGVGEQVEQKGSAGYAVCDYATQPWKAVTHYRRKRILCVWSVVGTHRTLLWGKEACGHSCEPGHYALRGTRWTPATAPEVTAAKAGRDPNGVVAWHGGKCPVGVGVEGYWHLRRGPAKGPYSLRDGYWGCIPSSGGSEIIAYEVTG